MTVEIVPKNKEMYGVEIANGTWFTMVNASDIKNVIGRQQTNDPVLATKKQTEQIAEKLKDWEIPKGWGEPYGGKELKSDLIEFFERCNGFETC